MNKYDNMFRDNRMQRLQLSFGQFSKTFCPLAVAQLFFCNSNFFFFSHFLIEPYFCKTNRSKHNRKPYNVSNSHKPAAIGYEWCYGMKWPPLLMKKRHTPNGECGSTLHYHACRCLTTTASEISGPSRIAAVIRSDLTLARCITSNNNTTLSQFQNIAVRGWGSACGAKTSFPPVLCSSASHDVLEELREASCEKTDFFQVFSMSFVCERH